MDSLADFLAAGKIGAVGLDVWENEPCTESPLHEFPNAILTPHLGASTKEAQLRAGVQTAEYVAAGLAGSIVPTAVNMAPRESTRFPFVWAPPVTSKALPTCWTRWAPTCPPAR